jgi:4-hydroxy-4-methyl-2-oxoglutarate aldolase
MNIVALSFKRPPKDIIERFRKLATPSICECLGGSSNVRTYMTSAIKPIVKGQKICGPALTCLCHVGDNLMLQKALQLAQAGDVLVVTHGGYTEAAPWGEMMSICAKQKGVEGLVMDGAVRDTPLYSKIGFPVFARGSAMAGTVKSAPGLVNMPIQCGEAYVKPGDIVIGDDDGVVVVPRERALEVLEKTEAREMNEEKTAQRILKGELTDFMDNYQTAYENLIKAGKLKEIPEAE